MAGRIQLIIGPMFSGKTTELMRLLKRYQIAKYRCMVIKYYRDTRYTSNSIISHDKQYLEAVNASKLNLFLDTANDYDVIGIDEGQFFPDIVSFANEMAERGKIVLVAALDATFERKAFGDILQLIPSCESVVKLTAVCMNCNKDASFTKRIGIEKEVEIIGGADKYLSVCRKCYSLDLRPSSSSLPSSPLKESSKENQMVSPPTPQQQQQPKQPLKKSPFNCQTSSVSENDFCNEDFQPPPLVNIKSNQTRGKLFSSP